LRLNPHKIKLSSAGSKQLVFATFRSEEEREKAIVAVDGYEWKGKVIKAIVS